MIQQNTVSGKETVAFKSIEDVLGMQRELLRLDSELALLRKRNKAPVETFHRRTVAPAPRLNGAWQSMQCVSVESVTSLGQPLSPENFGIYIERINSNVTQDIPGYYQSDVERNPSTVVPLRQENVLKQAETVSMSKQAHENLKNLHNVEVRDSSSLGESVSESEESSSTDSDHKSERKHLKESSSSSDVPETPASHRTKKCERDSGYKAIHWGLDQRKNGIISRNNSDSSSNSQDSGSSDEDIEKLHTSKLGKINQHASPTINCQSMPQVVTLSHDAPPEDFFDWEILSIKGPWLDASSLKNKEDPLNKEYHSQLKFSGADYIATFQWFILEESKAYMTSGWESLQAVPGPDVNSSSVLRKTASTKPRSCGNGSETTLWELCPLYPAAGDPFKYVQAKQVGGPRTYLDASEVVLLSVPKSKDIKTIAIVNSVNEHWVLLRTLNNGNCWDGQCVLLRMTNLVTLRRMYACLSQFTKTGGPLQRQVLDPIQNSNFLLDPPSESCSEEDVKDTLTSKTLLAWKAGGIFNNKQLLAMSAAFKLKQGFLLVQGPPGTGKSSTIIGIISALVIEEPGIRILVCSSSNAAVDELVCRLMHQMLDKSGKTYSPMAGALLRVGTNKSLRANCSPVFLDSVLRHTHDGRRPWSTAAKELLDHATVVCSTLGGSGNQIFDDLDKKFDVLIVDEAAQALETEILLAIQRVHGRCIMVGDPKQLPATVLQQPATAFGRSLFERMQEAGLPTYLLTMQYRMHPEISKYPSKGFYEGHLKDSPMSASMGSIFKKKATEKGINSHGRFFKLGHYCFLDVSQGVEQREDGSFSLSNMEEAMVVASVVAGAVKSVVKGVKPDIGVITPYLAQRSSISRYLERSGIDDSAYEVNTVDAFQGREKDVIILSCVRAQSENGLGFVSDERRMNVALTRAKYSLVIVGHAHTLQQNHSSWRKLIEDARNRGCYQVVNTDMQCHQDAIGYHQRGRVNYFSQVTDVAHRSAFCKNRGKCLHLSDRQDKEKDTHCKSSGAVGHSDGDTSVSKEGKILEDGSRKRDISSCTSGGFKSCQQITDDKKLHENLARAPKKAKVIQKESTMGRDDQNIPGFGKWKLKNSEVKPGKDRILISESHVQEAQQGEPTGLNQVIIVDAMESVIPRGNRKLKISKGKHVQDQKLLTESQIEVSRKKQASDMKEEERKVKSLKAKDHKLQHKLYRGCKKEAGKRGIPQEREMKGKEGRSIQEQKLLSEGVVEVNRKTMQKI